ncbi:MAG: hypothetical protein ACRDJC_19080, partial [Thermomicrobiales bacterium]
ARPASQPGKPRPMDGSRFESLVLSITACPSRRRLASAFVAGALSAVAATLGLQQEAEAACRHNGARCRSDTKCCSGNCRKKKGKRRCRPTPGARGCTIDTPCDETVPCPGAPDSVDSFCGITLAGKPYCATAAPQECADCASHAECEVLLNQPGARCVSCPGHCSTSNFRICVWFDETLLP